MRGQKSEFNTQVCETFCLKQQTESKGQTLETEYNFKRQTAKRF